MINRISADIASAMKKQEKERLLVLRALKAALKNREIELCTTLTEQEATSVLQKEVKVRQQAAEMFRQGGRDDLSQYNLNEIKIIEEYLPKALTREEIENAARAAVKELNATSMRDMGKIISHLKDSLGAQADGKTLSEVVKNILS